MAKKRIMCSFNGCTTSAQPSKTSVKACVSHGLRCSITGCKSGRHPGSTVCKKHGAGHRCFFVGCDSTAKNGLSGQGLKSCVFHGPRCSIIGCKSGQHPGSTLCQKHGAGRHCSVVGCVSVATSGSSMCGHHRGPIKCSIVGCFVVARGRGLCPRHMGDVCSVVGCDTPSRHGSTKCQRHQGGAPCSFVGCNTGALIRGGTCTKHGRLCSVTGCIAAIRHGSDTCLKHGGGGYLVRCKNDDVHQYEEFNPTVYCADRSKGVCFGCYESLYPEKLKRFARREHLMLAEITRLAPELMDCNHVVQDCPMQGGCSLHRPDMLFDFGTSWFSIEVDEGGHDQAVGKYEMITKAMNNVPGILLRINTCGKEPMFKKKFITGHGSRYDGSEHFESKMGIIMDCVKNKIIPVLTKDDFGSEFKEIKLFFDQ